MNLEDQGILSGIKKPGPITRAVAASGIAALPTDPDQDNRRQYSPNYGDAFANRGGSFAPSGPSNGPDSTALNPTAQGIAAPSQTGVAPVQPGAIQGTDAVAKPEARQTVVTHGAANTAENSGIAAPPIGRNDQGVITADSAAAAMENPMTRSGGIAGSYDGKGVNEIMARENAARGGMIDSMIKANGGNGIAVLGGSAPTEAEAINAERTNRWAIDDLSDQMKRAGTRTERAALGQALSQTIAGQSQQATEAMRQQGAIDQRGIAAGIEHARIAGADQRAADRNAVTMRGQDVTAATATDRMASQERIAGERNESSDTRLNLSQRRSNFEIDAARERVAGLSPEEIKRKTANYTATGRENPDFDPTLAKAVSLANRRKYGADDHFDQRQQAQQQAGSDGDVTTRFRADQAMQGHKLGNQTDLGVEVLDASGRLVGHYH